MARRIATRSVTGRPDKEDCLRILSSQFKTWWHAPITRRDRALAVFVGILGGLWMGALVRVLLGPLPVSLAVIGEWSLAVSALNAVLGACFPKAVTCVCYPLTTFSF